MAWNQRSETQSIKPVGKRRSGLKGIAAGTLVVIGAIVAGVWVFKGEKPVTVDKPAEQAKPALEEVTPAISTQKVEQVKVEKPNADPFEGLKPGEHRAVHWKRPANWDELSPGDKTRIQPVGRVIKPVGWENRNLFTERSDKKIARLLQLRPGHIALGEGQYGEQFTKDFLDSIKVPIVIEKDDTPEQAALKKAVIETRLELKDAYDRGEDIGKIMEDTERQFRQMARMKENLRKEILTARKDPNATKESVGDFIAAANKILEENGIEPFRNGKILYNKAKLEEAVGHQEESKK